MNTNETSARELKRRTLRWQKHKRPRRPDPSIAKRVIAVLLLLLLISIAGYTCGTAFARIGIHYEVGEQCMGCGYGKQLLKLIREGKIKL